MDAAPAPRRPDPATLLAFLAAVVILGANFVAVRFSNRELAPFWGASLRFASATLILFAIAFARRLPLPRGAALVGAVLYGGLAFGATYALAYWGLVLAPSATASLAFALLPLLTLLFAFAHGVEPMRWRGVAGALVSLGGIALIFREQISLNVPLLSLLALFLASISAAEATVMLKRFPRTHPVTTNAVAMAVGTVILYGVSEVTNEIHLIPTARSTFAALVWLILLGSVLAFVLFIYVINRWTASATAYQAVLSPVVTVLVAAWLAGEYVTPAFAGGAVLVLLGVYVGALHRAPPRPAPAPSPVPVPQDR